MDAQPLIENTHFPLIIINGHLITKYPNSRQFWEIAEQISFSMKNKSSTSLVSLYVMVWNLYLNWLQIVGHAEATRAQLNPNEKYK